MVESVNSACVRFPCLKESAKKDYFCRPYSYWDTGQKVKCLVIAPPCGQSVQVDKLSSGSYVQAIYQIW